MSAQHEKKADYRLIIILLSGAFVSFLSNTFLNVALPSIKDEFDVSTSTVQWVTTAYMLVSGVVVPTTAFLMQKFSARKLFLTALLLFLAGTIIAGFSPTFGVLILGRMIQASGSAILMPLLMNVMITSFPPEKRGTAMGVFSLVMFFAPAIGPTLSGFVVQTLSWHWLFYMMIPVLLIVLAVGYFQLPEISNKYNAKIDIPSVILSTIGFGGILYGFSAAGNSGWLSLDVMLTLLIGIITTYFYVMRQVRMDDPMLDFRVYTFPMYRLSAIIIGVNNMALFSGMILMPIFLQDIQGVSPLETGLLLLPGALIMGLLSPLSGKLFDMFGPRVLAVIGLALAASTTFFFSQLEISTGFGYLLTIYAIRAFGLTLVMTPVMTNGMNDLTPELTPHGSSLNSMLQQVSGAVGTALLISIMQSWSNFRIAGIPDPSPEQVNQAMLDGINLSFFIASILLFISMILSFFLKRVTARSNISQGGARVRMVDKDELPEDK
ncbi:DHA2 family efflux MFS transporter permease subunit [Salinicoccus halitifaciens]|uniref:Quinolone resistance protein NorB n=1 Tax=Salinicoccus halitifaciens TaxID=1073415 RepID=A0ABV2EBX9_9STAP|nr:DHA2 family efflux MFS transporter permease subunit [Salinicoccus halitifaciens]MCD2137432.1 DHA2 family efflux MFS transporter permease subunit [Salinicoccus halitifaciens]